MQSCLWCLKALLSPLSSLPLPLSLYPLLSLAAPPHCLMHTQPLCHTHNGFRASPAGCDIPTLHKALSWPASIPHRHTQCRRANGWTLWCRLLITSHTSCLNSWKLHDVHLTGPCPSLPSSPLLTNLGSTPWYAASAPVSRCPLVGSCTNCCARSAVALTWLSSACDSASSRAEPGLQQTSTRWMD